MEFSRQEYWSRLPFPSPEDLPDPGMEPWSPASQADSLPCPLLYYTVNLFFAVPCQFLLPPLVACTCSVMSNSLQPHALWTIAHQTPLSMKLSRQEYWSELSFLSPGDLPDPGIKLTSPALGARFFTTDPPGLMSMPIRSLLTYKPFFVVQPETLFYRIYVFSMSSRDLIKFHCLAVSQSISQSVQSLSRVRLFATP